MDDLPTLGAVRWVERGRVFKLFEVVIVSAVPDVYFSLETVAALLTVFPLTRMSFIVMVGAKGVTIVVPAATIPCIRKRDILVMVVAHPAPAAIGFSDFSGLATQATERLFPLELGCLHSVLALYRASCLYKELCLQTQRLEDKQFSKDIPIPTRFAIRTQDYVSTPSPERFEGRIPWLSSTKLVRGGQM
jgi:hypothetical protein